MDVLRHPLPFRLLAIVGDSERFNDVVNLARDVQHIGIGIMLRDPHHDESRIRKLGEYALQREIPGNVTIISNAIAIMGIPYVHCTSAQLRRAADADTTFQIADGGISYGVSAHSLEEAVMAEQLGAAYVTFSPLFPTGSKPGHPGAGISELKSVCTGVEIPVFALGGIDADNAGMCMEAGAFGIAGITLFAPEHRAMCRAIVQLLQD